MQRTREQGTPVRTAPIQRPAEGALSYVRPFSARRLSTKEAPDSSDLSLSWVSRAAIISDPGCHAYATQTRGDR